MSLESVFALLAGMALLSQFPTPREAAGCAVMLAAIVLAQLPGRKRGPGADFSPAEERRDDP